MVITKELVLDTPFCSECGGDLFGLGVVCSCETQSIAAVAEMVDYLVYVIEETAEAMKHKAGLAQSPAGSDLLSHSLELSNAAQQANSWAEGLRELI